MINSFSFASAFLVSWLPHSINQHQHRRACGLAAKKHKRRKRKTAFSFLCLLRLFVAMVAVCKDSINQNENGGILRRLHHLLKRLILRVWVFQFCGHVRHRLQETQKQAALHREIHILRQRTGGRQRRRRIQFGRHDAHHVPARVHQRTVPVRPIARLHGGRPQGPGNSAAHPPRPPATRFPPWWPCASTLGANPCNPMSGKPTVATVPPSFTVRLAAIGSGANRPTAFNKAKSFAASTFTTVASTKPALAVKNFWQSKIDFRLVKTKSLNT